MTNPEDFEAALDDLLDLGLTEEQAEDVWGWHRITAEAQAQTAGGIAIVRLLTYLAGGHRDANLMLRLNAVAFGTGLGHLTGHKDMSQAAAALGVSHAAVKDAAKQAARALLG
jgi:hypothetical protein